MDVFELIRPLALLSILIFAAVTDAVQRKVYNSLILTGLLAEAVIWWMAPAEVDPYSLVYMTGFLLLLFCFYARKMLGGADLKLYMLTIFAYPNALGLAMITASVVFGAVYALGMLLRCRDGCHAKLPMGVFILLGALFTIFKG